MSSIPKLTKDNYGRWLCDVKIALQEKAKATGHADGTTVRPAAVGEGQTKWDSLDAIATTMRIITRSLSDIYHSSVMDCTTAKGMIDRIKEHIERTSASSQTDAIQAWCACRFRDGMTVTDTSLS